MKRIDIAKKSNSFRIEFIALLEKYNAEITVTNTDGMTITFDMKDEAGNYITVDSVLTYNSSDFEIVCNPCAIKKHFQIQD
jgi:hypothetical protein